MARILFTTWEGGGHVRPLLMLAQSMQRRGHQVLVISDLCNQVDAAAYDLAFVPWRQAPSRRDSTPATDVLRDWEAPSGAATIERLCERVICGPAARYARDILDVLTTFRADIIVSHEFLFGAMMAAEASRTPLALFAVNIWMLPNIPGAPPLTGCAPPRDDVEAVRQARLQSAIRGVYERSLPMLNTARSELKLPALESLFDQLAIADEVMLATSRSFDFPIPATGRFARYVGPYLADSRDVGAGDVALPGGAGPLVIAAFSTSYQGHEDALISVIEALGRLPVRAIVSCGQHVSGEIGSPPANVHLVTGVSHAQVLPHASVFITHAGHGSVLRGLMCGVPLLCLPMGRDQNANSIRVVERGAGLCLGASHNPAAIAEAVCLLIEDSAYRRAAADLGRRILADEAARDAELVIEAMLAPVPIKLTVTV